MNFQLKNKMLSQKVGKHLISLKPYLPFAQIFFAISGFLCPSIEIVQQSDLFYYVAY